MGEAMSFAQRDLGPFEIDTIVVGDCLDVMNQLPDGCVDLIFVDPPYNIGIFCKMSAAEYLEWCSDWIKEATRVLKPNGAFWVIHKNPVILADLSCFIEENGRIRINWITWDKYNGNPTYQAVGGPMVGMTQVRSLRSFQQMAEYLVYHADDGQWQRQTDKVHGFIFESLRAYLVRERDRAGFTSRQVDEALGNYMSGHYFGRSQWALPTAKNYGKMRAVFNAQNSDEYLQREYEDLRREYKYLRPTFSNPGKVSSVWQGSPAPRNGHETPKPEWLLERIIKTTTNEGDIIADFFIGSGTTAVVAKQLGRHYFGCDISEIYVEMANQRVATVQTMMF